MPRRRLSAALGGACVLATLFGAPNAASQTCFSATPYSFLATGGPGSVDFSVTLPAGSYSITLDTWDGYENRSDSARQQGERVALDLLDGGGVIASTPATADLEDFVESAESSSTFSLTIDRAATVARVRHVPAGDGADSVFAAGIAVCPNPPTTTVPPTTVPSTTAAPTTAAPTTVPPTTAPPTTAASTTTVIPATAPPTTVGSTTSTTSPGRSLPGGPVLRQRTTTTTAPPTTVAAPSETEPTPASSTPSTTTGPSSGVNAAPSTTAPLDEDGEVRVLRQTTLNTIEQDGSQRDTLPFTGATSPWLIGVAMVVAGIMLAGTTSRTSTD